MTEKVLASVWCFAIFVVALWLACDKLSLRKTK
jgi:hypothetical protein